MVRLVMKIFLMKIFRFALRKMPNGIAIHAQTRHETYLTAQRKMVFRKSIHA